MFYLRTLDDTAWSIADVTGPIGTGTHIFDINFTANDQEYSSIRFVDGTDSGQVYFDATLVNEYPHGGWVDAAYQNVKIAGGVDATNPSLLSWFRQNAKNLTPSNDDASITKALQDIAEAISGGGSGGGGGMPVDYPYEIETLFEGNVECVNDNANIQGLDILKGIPLTITINGTKTDLFYDEADFWSDSYPYDEQNSTIELGYNDGGSMWLWMKDAPDGTYAVKIEGNIVDENFESAVKEIINEMGVSEKPFYEADLAAHDPNYYGEQLLMAHPLTICKAYINGIESPIQYMGLADNEMAWQIASTENIIVTISLAHHNCLIIASEPCHIAIFELSDTNIVIPATAFEDGYVLHVFPTDIMEVLKRLKYSFSLAIDTGGDIPSYGIYPLTFEFYYENSEPVLSAQSLRIFGTVMNGALDAEHGVFIFSAATPEN